RATPNRRRLAPPNVAQRRTADAGLRRSAGDDSWSLAKATPRPTSREASSQGHRPSESVDRGAPPTSRRPRSPNRKNFVTANHGDPPSSRESRYNVNQSSRSMACLLQG